MTDMSNATVPTDEDSNSAQAIAILGASAGAILLLMFTSVLILYCENRRLKKLYKKRIQELAVIAENERNRQIARGNPRRPRGNAGQRQKKAKPAGQGETSQQQKDPNVPKVHDKKRSDAEKIKTKPEHVGPDAAHNTKEQENAIVNGERSQTTETVT